MNVKIDSQHSSGKYDETICCEEEEELRGGAKEKNSLCCRSEW
jgi:hypothetical protein